MAKPDLMLWLSDARGIYIPRDFVLSFATPEKHLSGVTLGDQAILKAGPHDNPAYWDTWSDVLNSARVTDDHGNRFFLNQDGDLWLVPESWEWNERSEQWEEPHAAV